MIWTDTMKTLLLHLHDDKQYQHRFIADVLSREFGAIFTRNSCIGMYNQLKKKSYITDKNVIRFYDKEKTPAVDPC
jgi:hypothetical protein